MPATCCRTRWISCNTSSAMASRTTAVARVCSRSSGTIARCQTRGRATYQFEKLGRTVTFTGSMNTSKTQQPVEICGRDATLRFDDIAHDVTTFRNPPRRPQPAARTCPRATSAARHPSSPITWRTGSIASKAAAPRNARPTRRSSKPRPSSCRWSRIRQRRVVRWDAEPGRNRVRRKPS